MRRSIPGWFMRVAWLSFVVARAASAASDATHLVGPFTLADYPRAVIDRPLTLPRGVVEGEVGFSFASQTLDPAFLGVGGVDRWDTDVALRVGVTDWLQLEAATSFNLDYHQRRADFEGIFTETRPTLSSWNRTVPVRLSVLALDTETLDTAVTLTIPFLSHSTRTNFLRSGSIEVSNGPNRVVPEVDLGAPTRWRLTDWLWLRAAQDLFAVSTVDGTASFAFNVGIGVQPLPIFAATLDTRIATVAFDGSGHSTSETLADRGTILLEGTLAPCRYFDLIGDLDLPDVGSGVDDWLARLAFRVRI